MTLTVKRFSDESNTFQKIPAGRISDELDGEAMIWVDVLRPDDDDVTMLRNELQIPPLVLEDIGQTNRTPTFRQYGDNLFVVFYALTCPDKGIDHHPLSLYVMAKVIVSIRQGEITALEDVPDRFRQDVAETGHNTPVTLLYSVLDAIVDGYFPVLDEIADLVEGIEDRILDGEESGIQREIVDLRRTLLVTRRVLAAERESLIHVFRKDHPTIDATMLPYFQDVYDHVNRATESLDGAREMLASTMDAYLSQVNNELNIVVRRLTSWTIILMFVTLIAGIYGMNFDHMPELHWRLGYPFALGLMALVATTMVIVFRRIKWL